MMLTGAAFRHGVWQSLSPGPAMLLQHLALVLLLVLPLLLLLHCDQRALQPLQQR